jgi:hypothetical protein
MAGPGPDLAAIGLGACGDADGDEPGAATTSGVDSDVSADPGEGSEEILIQTQVEIGVAEELRGSNVSEGEVLDGSSIGDSPFCPGGVFRDAHSEDPEIGSWTERFSAPTAG